MALWYAWKSASDLITDPIDINKPNVPTEPMIYSNYVLITPFGPAPFCKIENPPNKTPTQTPTVEPIMAPILNFSALTVAEQHIDIVEQVALLRDIIHDVSVSIYRRNSDNLSN